MSNVHVIDASAILAYLQEEKGHELMEAAFEKAPTWATTVNLCEVLSQLCEKGMPAAEAQGVVQDLGLKSVDFDWELAVHASAMRVKTMLIGASLGDRACLGLAQSMASAGAIIPIVYTAEQAWAKVKWPFKIVLIR